MNNHSVMAFADTLDQMHKVVQVHHISMRSHVFDAVLILFIGAHIVHGRSFANFILGIESNLLGFQPDFLVSKVSSSDVKGIKDTVVAFRFRMFSNYRYHSGRHTLHFIDISNHFIHESSFQF